MHKKDLEKIIATINDFASNREIIISKIILFGSEVKENADGDSDIDLVIVSNEFSKINYTERIKKLLGINRALVKLTDRPIDILYYSDNEWDNTLSPMIQEAKLTGKVLYSYN